MATYTDTGGGASGRKFSISRENGMVNKKAYPIFSSGFVKSRATQVNENLKPAGPKTAATDITNSTALSAAN